MIKNKARNWLAAAIVLTAGLGLAVPASAAVILSPVSATVETGTNQFGVIKSTIDQAGLLDTFSSGVTNFDTYIASSPMHSFAASGEWFAQPVDGLVSVRFDLGALYTLSSFALWNEELFGVPSFILSVSADGNSYTPVLSNVSPTSNDEDQDYSAQRFDFGEVAAQYVRFEAFDCGDFCGIGEVAFRGNEIPEPGILGLAGIGLFALGLVLRRRGRSTATRAALQ